jgi:RimJ/RimL family protein N-acetyltransferase
MMQFTHYHIRLLEPDDAPAYFRLISANRDRLEDFFAGMVARTQNLQDTVTFVAGAIERMGEKTYFPFVIMDTVQECIAGFIDVKNIDWNIPKAELGCFMDKDYAGRGIARQALGQVIAHLFGTMGFNKLFLRTHQSNDAARALAGQCGFEQEGIIRRDYKTTKGELVDLLYYGLIKQ